MTAAAASVEAAQRRVVLIDLSALFWTAWHSSGNDAVSMAKVRTLEAVAKCTGQAGDLVAICCDSGRSFRKDIDPKYKAQRPEKDHASLAELDRVKERLRADGRLLWEVRGYEADDVIATAAVAARAAGHEVLICSADKDLLQLAGPGVLFLRTNTWAYLASAEAGTKFGEGIMPSQIGDWLALVGDKSDNIAGAPGVGPAKATALLLAHKTLSGIWTACEKDLAAVAKLVGQAVAKTLATEAVQEQVCKARVLIGLRSDAPITFAEIFEERQAARSAEKDEDDMEVIDIEEVTTAKPEPSPPAAANGNAAPAAAPAPEAKALVVAPTGIDSFDASLMPVDMRGVWWLAKRIAESRLYERYPSPEAVMVTIVRGREMGLSPLTALDCFHVIDGKPCPLAHLLVARAKGHPKCAYFRCVETSDKLATYETRNTDDPEPTRLTFTWEQAQAANLPKSGARGPNAWLKTPDDMLRKACAVKLARIVYPDATLGLYAAEEMGGDAA